MKSVLLSYTTPVSWDSMAKRSSVRSHVTIGSYIGILTNIFVLIDCYFFDMNKRVSDYGKNKKFYFYDPFILRIFEERLNIRLEKEKIIEGIVGCHLKNKNIPEEIHYTKIKKETDFVVGEGGIEVKYQTKISDEDFQNRRFFKDYLILSKGTYGQDVVPVHTYLFSYK
jgi:predicted AAA+ superfamily ATPase